MDLLGESLSSQGDAPPPRRTQRRAPGFVSQDGWLLEALCACVAPFCNRPRVPALPVPAVAALLAQGVDGAGEAMALACKKEIEAPCFAHFQVQERGEAVTCLYPPFARGTCFQVPEGMLHAAISNRAVVHIQDSGVDPRVHATVDALDFLRDEWSLTPANSAQSPMLEKQRTNLAALRQRYGPGDAPLELKVGWENAVVVPVLDPEAQATTGLLVMVNRKVLHPQPSTLNRSPFTKSFPA
ncbi:hypothetical protein T484DRAFT_2567813 [Baffinella frigidus]|nr:hypothetical protein T484DRAFT_2567813 [Cryptophyta sp. CCMP2293]